MLRALILIVFLTFSIPSYAFISDEEVASFQKELQGRPAGERIAFWAEKFIGTPYDPDPLGEYVSRRVIVADERVDCMYLLFRSLELSLSNTPSEAIQIALDKRFIDRGKLENGKVINYEDRFKYGEDMLQSGKWGREITEEMGLVMEIKGSRGREKVKMISREVMQNLISKYPSVLKSGDILYFIKEPSKRVMDEIVGHMGIVKNEIDALYLIHASGSKNNCGEVRKVLLSEYISSMHFIGVKVGRFE